MLNICCLFVIFFVKEISYLIPCHVSEGTYMNCIIMFFHQIDFFEDSYVQ